MVSYVMSLQYFAIFRCDSGFQSDGHLLDLANANELGECKWRIQSAAHINAFVDSVTTILTASAEDGHADLAGLGSDLIQKTASSPWIGKILSGEDSSNAMQGYDCAWSAKAELTDRLTIWFAHKLQGEMQRHTAGHHAEEDDQVFNETDRIVAAVLDMRPDAVASTSTGEMCLCTTLCCVWQH